MSADIEGHGVSPAVRTITVAEVWTALRKGLADFDAHPTPAILVAILYPVIGLIVIWAVSDRDLLQLVFPLIAGFTLVGPFFAVGLYELSRRSEQGLSVQWQDAFSVFRSVSFGSILTLGGLLTVIFLLWLAVALVIYSSTMGSQPPASVFAFMRRVFATEAGWTLIIIGNAAGFVFALIAFSISVVSFPLLVDRDVGPMRALAISVKAVARNPRPMAAWGMIVTAALVIGALPFLFGLAVVFPVLGHATWHLYRAVVRD